MVDGVFSIQHYLFVEDLKLLVYVMTFMAAIALVVGIYTYYKRWTWGGQKLSSNNIGARLRNFVKLGLLQARVVRKPYEGLMHLSIYVGIILLLVATVLRFIEADFTLPLFGQRILTGTTYAVYKFMANIGGVLLILGILLAWVRRLAGFTRELPDGVEDHAILGLFAFLAISGFILDGILTAAYRFPDIGIWDPIGMIIAAGLTGWDPTALVTMYRALWTMHMVVAIAAIGALPYTKLGHIIISGFFNTFYARLEHPSAFKPIPDVEKIVEEGKTFGIVKLIDTTWKQRMDYDACTKCARCHNACPANLTGKPLSPMNLMLTMREALRNELWDEELVPAKIDPNIVWSCVTCGACVYECPVAVHHVETILDLRRGLVSKGENIPDELLQASYNIMRTGNPYGANPFDKEEWLRKLIDEGLIEEAKPEQEYEYLLWIGCAVAYDPRLRGTVEALLRVLKRAGVSVAVALEQQCCGEPARRIGDELLFTELVKQNKELLSNYRFRKLLVTCPHGYNVFKHEYPLYGVRVDVEHHSQLLARLLREGKIKARKTLEVKATYHDPCYLGRWNKVFDEPRLVVSRRVKEVAEMPRSREHSFCCGGGGGGVFYDIKIGERISKARMREAAGTGAKIVAVACPFCNVMLGSEAPEHNMEVKDIAELLEEATRE